METYAEGKRDVHGFLCFYAYSFQVTGAAMPASLLWAVDVYGRVFSLSTAGQQWEQCHDIQMEFKRVAAARQCCWGIACDNNIYLNVHASDLPVRYQEEAYENQVSSCQEENCGCVVPLLEISS